MKSLKLLYDQFNEAGVHMHPYVFYTLRQAVLPAYVAGRPEGFILPIKQGITPNLGDMYDVRLNETDLFAIDHVTLSMFTFLDCSGHEELKLLLQSHPILRIYINQRMVAEGPFIPMFDIYGSEWTWTWDVGVWIVLPGNLNIRVDIITRSPSGFEEVSAGFINYHGLLFMDMYPTK
jgi:hypothetical protein